MEKYFTRFNNLFHGIIAGPLLVFVYLYLQLDSGKISPYFGEQDFKLISGIAFIINLGYIFWVFRWFRGEKRALIGKYDLRARLEVYRALSSKFYFLMTLSGCVGIVAILLTGELTFAFIYMLQLFLLSVYRPSVHNICKFLNLQGDDREIVLKKKEFKND